MRVGLDGREVRSEGGRGEEGNYGGLGNGIFSWCKYVSEVLVMQTEQSCLGMTCNAMYGAVSTYVLCSVPVPWTFERDLARVSFDTCLFHRSPPLSSMFLLLSR